MSDDLEYKGYRAAIEFSREDRMFFGKVLFIDSLLMFHGASIDELESAFHQTIDGYLEHCQSKGKLPNKTYSGSFNIRIGKERHEAIAKDAYRLRIKSQNDYVCQALDAFMANQQELVIEHRHQGEVKFHITMEQELPMENFTMAATEKSEDTWKLH